MTDSISLAVVPRGIRNNNPLNIRIIKGTTWVGQVPDSEQTDDAFVQFTDPVYGIRAGTRILINYYKRGLHTIAQIIDQWSPPNENNSKAYIDDVCQDCSCGEDDILSWPSALPSLIKAMINHEEGSQPYTDTQIALGISYASS